MVTHGDRAWKTIDGAVGANALRRSLGARWSLTPLLDDADVVAKLRDRSAPALLVGGTNDPTWISGIARSLTDHVLELDGADHGLARTDQASKIGAAVDHFARGC